MGRPAVAAIIALCVCIPVVAIAFVTGTFDKYVGSWSSGHFIFEASEPPEPDYYSAEHYYSLEEGLKHTSLKYVSLPAWIPEGYELDVIDVYTSIGRTDVCVNFFCEEILLSFGVHTFIEGSSMRAEMDGKVTQTYISNGKTYYIFSNNKRMTIAWMDGNYECYICGEISTEEAIKIVDSIGKE